MMNNEPTVNNSNLDAQNPMHALAHVASDECGGWAGDGSGVDDLADYGANEMADYRDE